MSSNHSAPHLNQLPAWGLALCVFGVGLLWGCPTVPSAKLRDPDPVEEEEEEEEEEETKEEESQKPVDQSGQEGAEEEALAPPMARPKTPRLAPGLQRLEARKLPRGPSARAQPGDWALVSQSGFVFAFSDLSRKHGFHESGGKLIDLAPAGGEDVFDGFSTWLDRSFPRQARYEVLREAEGTLVATGIDGGAPDITVETRYRLLPTENNDPAVWGHLVIETSLSNRGENNFEDYDLGDMIAWGGLRHFAPGPGFALRGEQKDLPWIGGEGEHYALLLVGETGAMDGPHGSSWSDPVYNKVNISPGGQARYVRHLLVGPSLGVLLPQALDLLASNPVPVEVRVLEEGTNRPVERAQVAIGRLSRDGKSELQPYLIGRTDGEGHLLTALPEGQYRALASSPSRSQSQQEDGGELNPVARGPGVKTTLTLSKEGQLLLEAVNGSGKPIPARFSFEILPPEGEPGPLRAVPENRPDFGPDSRAIGAHRAHIRGRRVLALPPGRYRILASAGPASALDSTTIVIDPDLPQRWQAKLPRLVQPEGWLQCDLHQHSQYSPDSAVPAVEGLLASASEGLDCIATTEHDAVVDWRQHLKEAALPDPLLWLPGIEVTSPKQGHYNAYPWAPALGTIEHQGLRADEILAKMRTRAPEAVLQVNHPEMEDIGLFGVIGKKALLDSASRTEGRTYDFDVLELLNGRHIGPGRKILDTWLGLLDQGKISTVVGTSDSHRLVGQERGLSRTWIEVNEASAAKGEDIARSLRETRRATASTGPFLDLRREDGVIVVELQAPDWMPVDSIHILQGPPGKNGKRERAVLRPEQGLEEILEGGLRRWIGRLPEPVAVGGLPQAHYLVGLAESEEDMEPWMDCPAFAVTNPLWLGTARP